MINNNIDSLYDISNNDNFDQFEHLNQIDQFDQISKSIYIGFKPNFPLKNSIVAYMLNTIDMDFIKNMYLEINLDKSFDDLSFNEKKDILESDIYIVKRKRIETYEID